MFYEYVKQMMEYSDEVLTSVHTIKASLMWYLRVLFQITGIASTIWSVHRAQRVQSSVITGPPSVLILMTSCRFLEPNK